MGLFRGFAVCAVALAIAMAGVTPAQAAVPSNDTYAGAQVISLGSSITADVAEATTDATDSAVAATCNVSYISNSVWYRFDATADASGMVVDVRNSSFSAGVIILQGSPADPSVIACGHGVAGFQGAPGLSYYIVVFADAQPITSELSLTATTLPPKPAFSLTLDSKASVDKLGRATVTGSYSCFADSTFTYVAGMLAQTNGRYQTSGDFEASNLVCDGVPHKWSAVAVGTAGPFSGGKAASATVGLACGVSGCTNLEATKVISLARNG